MKISLSSLCLILTLTFSALECNQSDPFNQKRSDVQKEIKTDIGEDDTIKNLRRANVVGALLGLHAGAYLFCKNDQNLALMCVSGAILNRVSELNLDVKHSETNTLLCIANFVWSMAHFSRLTISVDALDIVWQLYSAFKGTVHLANLIHIDSIGSNNN